MGSSRGSAARRARLARLRALGKSLPEAQVLDVPQRHVAFRVGKKTFAYYLNSHHDDGIVSIACKSTSAAQRRLVAGDPASYYAPAYLGASGWVALRLDLPRVDWDSVLELMVAAYRLQAPQRLARQLE